ncbi:MAG: CinA family protein [Bacillota bacterium]
MKKELFRLTSIVGRQLKERGWQIAVAESCTGGLLGYILTTVPGSSEYFYGGVISYSNQAKLDLLGVNSDTLAKWGAVSELTAQEMAEGIRKQCHVQLGVAITGIAGPGGGSQHKPVGLVYLALASEDSTSVIRRQFSGDRSQVRQNSALEALKLIQLYLESTNRLS